MALIPPSSSHEPRWRPQRRVSRSTLPAYLRPWLLDIGSLTERLMLASRNNFRVQVVRQRYDRPMRNEAHRLDVDPSAFGLIREVLLVCGGVPWVYARTVIPRRTLDGRGRRLARLRARSLGAVLFADPTTERDEMEFAVLTPGDCLYQSAARACDDLPPALWGRRTRFHLQGKPLLVNEIFLPPLGKFTS